MLRHQLDTLILYDPDRATATVNAWVAHPSGSEEQRLGTLFVVSAIDGAGRVNHEVLSLLQEELKQRFYQSDESRLEGAFEGALQQTNRRLHDLIREGVADWSNHAHILAGAFSRDRLVVTTLGTMHAFLVRQERLHDLIGPSPVGKPNPLRLFDHVVAGQIEAGDRLLFCTPSLLDYFSMEKIRRTVLDYPPDQVARLLEATLLGVGPRLSFSALVLAFETGPQPTAMNIPVHGIPSHAAPQLSMDQLVARERSTEKIMAPSIWPTIRDLGINVRRGFERASRSMLGRPPRRSIATATPKPEPRSPSRPWAERSPGSKHWSRSFFTVVQNAFARFRNTFWKKPTLNATPRVARWSLTSLLQTLVNWYKHLVPTQQRIVLAVLALITIFSTALVRGADLRPISNGPANQLAITSIEQSLDQAEASLLFGGDELANGQLDDAALKLEDLPHRRRSDQLVYDRLRERLDALRVRARRITVVSDPEIIAQFAPGFPDFVPAQLYLSDTTYVVFDPGLATVVVGKTDSQEQTAAQNTLDTGTPRTGAMVGLTRLIFATDRGTFVEYSLTENRWLPLDSRFPVTQPTVQSLSVFQTRLYALDPAHQQIYRFAIAPSSLGNGSAWLREAADLGAARAAVVDGSIFVLQPNGKVQQYFSGRVTDFILDPIDPALSNPTRIWTSETSSHVYLLEPERNRVVVFDKDGRLINQYQSDSWTRLRDLVVDVPNRQLYVVSGTTLYRVPITGD